MEAFETRRKFCRITQIAMIAVALLYCVVYIIIVKSTDILADSLGGVQSVEANNMALQWVFKQSQGFKAWTIVFCVFEVVCFCCLFYCYLEGVGAPKTKQTHLVNTENSTEAQEEFEKGNDGRIVTTSVVSAGISEEDQMSDKESQDERDTSIEDQIMNYLSGYKHKYIWAYAYYWLTNNGSLYDTSQEDFIRFVKDYTNIDVSKTHISKRINKLKGVLNNPKSDDTAYKEYGRVSDYLASRLKKNQPFEINNRK